MSPLEYVCDHCGGTFTDPDPDAAIAEAETTFAPTELADAARLCDTCWHDLLDATPELRARYGLP